MTLPTAVPYLMTGIRIASSLAVISALVAEYFGGPRGGLGSAISTSAATSAYARAWAYVVAAIAVGLAVLPRDGAARVARAPPHPDRRRAMTRAAPPSSSRRGRPAPPDIPHRDLKGTT